MKSKKWRQLYEITWKQNSKVTLAAAISNNISFIKDISKDGEFKFKLSLTYNRYLSKICRGKMRAIMHLKQHKVQVYIVFYKEIPNTIKPFIIKGLQLSTTIEEIKENLDDLPSLKYPN